MNERQPNYINNGLMWVLYGTVCFLRFFKHVLHGISPCADPFQFLSLSHHHILSEDHQDLLVSAVGKEE